MIQPPHTHLAQLNVARALDDLGSPRLADRTQHGPSDSAFGWERLHNIKLRMSRRCA